MRDIHSIGLVLSGGGAKGAYHLGLARALTELGLLDKVTAVSGSSIGAFNMTLLLSGGLAAMEAAWADMAGDEMLPGCTPAEAQEKMEALSRRAAAERPGKAAFCTEPAWHLAEPKPLRRRLAEYAPAFTPETPEAFACLYCVEEERPRYVRLNGLTRTQRDEAVTASCSVPGLFPPVEIGGLHYTDGGFCPPVCDPASRVDVVPLHPLRGRPFDLLILAYLFDNPGKNLAGVPAGTRVVELFPREPRAWTEEPTAPMLYDPQRLNTMARRGYENAMAALSAQPERSGRTE